MTMRAKTAPEFLELGAELYRERNKLYGDNYKRFGSVMMLLFPDGLKLETKNDHNRFGVFVQIIGKITRYAEQFEKGGHPDSLEDNMVYSAMLRELDEAIYDEEASVFDDLLSPGKLHWVKEGETIEQARQRIYDELLEKENAEREANQFAKARDWLADVAAKKQEQK